MIYTDQAFHWISTAMMAVGQLVEEVLQMHLDAAWPMPTVRYPPYIALRDLSRLATILLRDPSHLRLRQSRPRRKLKNSQTFRLKIWQIPLRSCGHPLTVH